jgi:3-dehydroquinate synthase
MVVLGCRRRDPVIAIGGGVCLDVVGLACNLYRRGTPVIKVPTTLMGVVDASIGIKTAVNWGPHKNKLGTYSPPLAVFIDRSFLQVRPSCWKRLKTVLSERWHVDGCLSIYGSG